MEKGVINARFIEAVNYLLSNNIEPNKAAICDNLKIKPSKFSEILNQRMNVGTDLAAMLTKSYNIDANWLLTGRGSMLNSEEVTLMNNKDAPKKEDFPEITILHKPKITERKIHQQAIKLYDVAAAANLRTLFDNKDQNILGEIMIPDIPKCDGAVYVNGDSMYPLLKSGDIIAYKEIYNLDYLIFGEMYLVSFDMDGDDYLAVKYINRSDVENYVKLVSYNPHHDPMDIPVKSINTLGLVKFSIRKNTMI